MDTTFTLSDYIELDFTKAPIVWRLPESSNLLYCDQLFVNHITEQPSYLVAKLYEVHGHIANVFDSVKYKVNVLQMLPQEKNRVDFIQSKLTHGEPIKGEEVLKCIMSLPVHLEELSRGALLRQQPMNSGMEIELTVKRTGGLDDL